MIRRLALLVKEIADENVRENFRRIADFLRDDPIGRGRFDHYDFNLSAPTYPSTVSIPHNLAYVPLDIIQTYLTGGTLTWLYSQFTRTHLKATISAAVRVRVYVGAYGEGRIQ